MKNSFGNHLTVTLFGESHGPAVGAVLDGLAPGLPVRNETIERWLTLRRPADGIGTARVESDPFEIVSGVLDGKATGTPLCLIIPNQNTKSEDYARSAFRPGHADYTAFCKYHGFEDHRGGGHFSGRVTAPLVAAGAIAYDALRSKGIVIGSHIAACAAIEDAPFTDPDRQANLLTEMPFPLLDPSLEPAVRQAIESAKAEGDSVGGVLETAVAGLPAGVGEPWFDTVEGLLAHALFSVPAVKGVEFGDGFAAAHRKGSQVNDALRVQNGTVITVTNHNGGVNGGIINGMPLIFRCAVKPTPSIAKSQQSVDPVSMQNVELSIRGRHDPAIVPRACVVVNAVTALTLYDLLAGRFGTDWFME